MIAIAAALIAAANAGASMPNLLIGEFGGAQSRFVASPTGGVLSLGCGSASIAAPIRLDRHGRFTATGHYDDWQGGPQLVEDGRPAKTDPARFDGEVKGTTLTLTITRGTAPPQVLTFEQGRRSKIIGCY